MGIMFSHVAMMLPAIKATRAKPGARILLLGTQDCYFTYDQITAFLTRSGVDFEPVPPAEQRCTNSFAYVSHEDWWRHKDFLHQETFFRLFGFSAAQIDTLDVSTYENCNIVHDLNLPLPPGMSAYDLVIDCGTLEHVFDVRQALWNLCELVRTGGRVLHMMPANLLDHGFYNFNSILLSDFYGQAGWINEELSYMAQPTADLGSRFLYVRIELSAFKTPPAGFYLVLVGQFRKQAAAIKPIAKQGLYLQLHDAWTRQTRAQSSHEPPPPKWGDWSSSLFARIKSAIAFFRAWIAARQMKGQTIWFELPPR